MSEDATRIWKFLSEQVIFRDSLILNKYQNFIKIKAQENLNDLKIRKHKEEIAAKSEFKKQVKRQELLMKVGVGGL